MPALIAPGTALTDPFWLHTRLTEAARAYHEPPRPVLGVLWWYSASSAVLGPTIESLVATGSAADPDLRHLTVYVGDGGLVLDARSTVSLSDSHSLGTALARMLTTAIDAVVTATEANVRALWAIATDSLANRVLWAGADPNLALGLASAVNRSTPDHPLPVPRFVTVGGRWFTNRASCCLIYQVPNNDKCVSCPRQTPQQRLHRLRAATSRS